jgi:hypothetical protein
MENCRLRVYLIREQAYEWKYRIRINNRFTTKKSVTISKINNNGEFYLCFFEDISERKQAAAAIQAKMENMAWFNDLSIGRELKMIELKKEINELLKQLGLDEKHVVHG